MRNNTHSFSPPIRSLLSSVICQLLGFCLAILAWQVAPSITFAGITFAMVAVLTALFLKLPTVWILFNGALPLGLWFIQPGAQLAWIPLVALLLLFILFLPTMLSGVPYYPSSKQAYQIVLDHLPEEKHFKFIDLGCGFAGMLVFLSRRRPLGTFVGIEISPLAYLLSRASALIHRSTNLKIKYHSLWAVDLKEYDVVYAFLSPLVMEKLWEKVQSEMRPGSIFISNSFETPGQPEKIYQLEDDKKCRVLLYRIPALHNL